MAPKADKWNRGKKPPRKQSVRRILVLCEDTKSSCDYLARFPFDAKLVSLECVGTGMNTDSLMENAIQRKEDAAKAGNPFAEIWVVFDRDSFDLQNFNRAFDLARSHGDIVACWSNECFELWYLLHFAYRDTGIARAEIWKVLSTHLGKKYDKADATVFAKLEPHLEAAVKNARKLAASRTGDTAKERENPSTKVHELVERLRQLDPSQM